jgi:hypothetical protein
MFTRTELAICFSRLACSVLLAGAGLCFAQDTSKQPGYLELNWFRVKQDKVAEFGQLANRIADANRRGKGDHWIACMDIYGRDNHVWMLVRRTNLAEIEPGMASFFGALKEFAGYSPERFMAESSKVVESSGAQLLRVRMDLSWGFKDVDEWTQLVAKSRYMAVVTVHVKPGRTLDADTQLRTLKEAIVSHGETSAASVVQLVLGGDPGTLYVRIPLESVTDIEKMGSPRGALGEEGYKRYSEMSAQNISSFEYTLMRFVPEWSNAPESFIQANPALWKVKPMIAAKPKAAATADKKPVATTGGQ